MLPKGSIWIIFPLFGYWIGALLDNQETERLSLFRDKSALYGRTLNEDEGPSWP